MLERTFVNQKQSKMALEAVGILMRNFIIKLKVSRDLTLAQI